MYIAIDFDGTIVEHNYPKIGAEVPFAIETLKMLIASGHELILFTMRSDLSFLEALDFCASRGVVFSGGYNTNKTQGEWTNSPKAYAHLYVDDAALGCPLIHPVGARPYVNWVEVQRLLKDRGFLKGDKNA